MVKRRLCALRVILRFDPVQCILVLEVATYDLESVVDNADSHELLAVVAAVHHQRVGKTLNDRAVGLAEALDGVATGRVGDVDGVADRDVIAVRVYMLAYAVLVVERRPMPPSVVRIVTYVREMSRTSTS